VKRTLVAVALVVVFVMALAAPAFAQAITHSATYEMDGAINFQKQMGHLCNTGAEVLQTIMGSGQMDKVQTVSMVSGKITMQDANDGVAGATPLTVTTVWELCTPPKYIYDDGTYDGVVHPAYLYPQGAGNTTPRIWAGMPGEVRGVGAWDGYDVAELVDYSEFDAVSEQIWAVQVQADPGYSINVHQDGVAAYGRFDGTDYFNEDDGTEGDVDDASWGWEDNGWDVVVGDDYVGDYFIMDQHARTSMGTLKRYIDISSPWSHGYLYEDMSVVGKSDVQEAFALNNLPAGADVPGDWWKLF
jgi:hypothetical protein